MIQASGRKPGVYVQAGTSGTITSADLPADMASAIAIVKAVAEPAVQAVRLHRIDATNWQQFVGRHATGYVKSHRPHNLPRLEDTFPIIPRSQWAALVKEGQGTFLSDLLKARGVKVKDQDSLGYCWVYASTETVEAAGAVQGQPYVELAPESIGGRLTGWRNRGRTNGAGCLAAVDRRWGLCRELL